MTHNYVQTNIPTGIFNFNPDLTAQPMLTTLPAADWGWRLFYSAILLAEAPTAQPGCGTATLSRRFRERRLARHTQADHESRCAVGACRALDRALSIASRTSIRTKPIGPCCGRHNGPGNIDLVDSEQTVIEAISPDWNQFAPRVGIAYQVTQRLFSTPVTDLLAAQRRGLGLQPEQQSHQQLFNARVGIGLYRRARLLPGELLECVADSGTELTPSQILSRRNNPAAGPQSELRSDTVRNRSSTILS